MRLLPEPPNAEVAEQALGAVEQIATGVLSYLEETEGGKTASEETTTKLSRSIELMQSVQAGQRDGYGGQDLPVLSEEFRLIWGAWEHHNSGSGSWGDIAISSMLEELLRGARFIASDPRFFRDKPAVLARLISDKLTEYRAALAADGTYARPYELRIAVPNAE